MNKKNYQPARNASASVAGGSSITNHPALPSTTFDAKLISLEKYA